MLKLFSSGRSKSGAGHPSAVHSRKTLKPIYMTAPITEVVLPAKGFFWLGSYWPGQPPTFAKRNPSSAEADEGRHSHPGVLRNLGNSRADISCPHKLCLYAVEGRWFVFSRVGLPQWGMGFNLLGHSQNCWGLPQVGKKPAQQGVEKGPIHQLPDPPSPQPRRYSVLNFRRQSGRKQRPANPPKGAGWPPGFPPTPGGLLG